MTFTFTSTHDFSQSTRLDYDTSRNRSQKVVAFPTFTKFAPLQETEERNAAAYNKILSKIISLLETRFSPIAAN